MVPMTIPVEAKMLGIAKIPTPRHTQASWNVAARIEDHPAIKHIYIQTGPELARGRVAPVETIGQVGLTLVDYTEREHS